MPSHSLDVLALLDPVVPPKLAARAEDWSPSSMPAVARASASVILCRDSVGGGLETYLLHRHDRMRFAASMAVFPGGGLDPVDRTSADPLQACAIRETREETGVELAAEALVPWAHWITPEIQPIRYDTCFYLAVLPAGQVAQDTSSETASAGWVTPAAAVEAYWAGSLQLMPPTLSVLLELAELPSVAAAIEVGRDRVIEPVLPQVVREAAGWVFRYPRHGGGDD